MKWFDVDKAGLAAILERRGKAFALFELIQNAWDSDPTCVQIRIEPVANAPFVAVDVIDDGEGFESLDHAYTMFAPSRRADNPRKRGRFNLGEKLVLGLARSATIVTTSGSLIFDMSGRRMLRNTRDIGTHFWAELRMTRDEMADVLNQLQRLIPPVKTLINGEPVPEPVHVCTFETKLPTEIADPDGNLRRSMRTAVVDVFESHDDQGDLLEMGIPVCDTEIPFRVNVQQKIPLTMERDNVTTSFMRAIGVAVLNETAGYLTSAQSAESWAVDAMGDSRATRETVNTMVKHRFGENAVVASPTEPMSNAAAAASGCTVVHGGSMSADAWANVRKYESLTPASAAFPQPKPAQMAKAKDGRCPTCGQPLK